MSLLSSIDRPRAGMIFLLALHSVFLTFSGLALCVVQRDVALSFAMAAGLVSFSCLSIGTVLYWMFLKKSIALLIGVIVFKWPILIYVVLLFMKHVEVHYPAFALGSMIWLPAGLVWHFIASRE